MLTFLKKQTKFENFLEIFDKTSDPSFLKDGRKLLVYFPIQYEEVGLNKTSFILTSFLK